ncbi:MAG: glycosyltransferase [Thermomicrobiales bacterium]
MRIGFYLGHYPTPGGTTMVVRGLTQALARAGHHVVVLAQGQEKTSGCDGPVQVQSFRRPVGKLPFRVSRELLRYVRTNQDALDLIVLNGAFHPDLPPLARAARQAPLPYVVAPFDPLNPALFANHALRKRGYFRLVERSLLNQAAAVQVMADAHGKYLLRLGVTSPVITVANGYDVEPPNLRPIRQTRDGPLALGYLGRLDAWHKGLDIMLEGFALAANRSPGLRLVLQGADWGDEQMLRQLASRLGLADAVTFKGRSWDSSVDVISQWDVFLSVSRFDGFQQTVIEAMLAGRPVVCSAEAGSAEHVERAGCGVVIEPTPASLADGIGRLIECRAEWPAMGASGRAYVLEHLTWNRIGAGAADAYSALV